MSKANAIEQLKAEKNGLDVLEDIHRWAEQGWESIPEREYDRLKWYGVFFRKATPGYFMIRVRVPGGMLQQGRFRSVQFRALAEITREFGRDILDVTTRQQVQLRWIRFENIPEIFRRLEAVGLTSRQTGIDNIRNVTGCPVAGLDPREVIDATPLVRELTDWFVGNREMTNLPRKFNISVTGCRDNCAHAEINDIGLTPSTRGGVVGFNVRVAGAMGSWGVQQALPLGWVAPDQVLAVCRHILEIYRDHGPREDRKKARLKFLIADWGLDRFRAEVEDRCGWALPPCGPDDTEEHSHQDHIGVHPQKQPGLYYVGLLVRAGRLRLEQAFELCRLAEEYGDGELRLTTGQNVIIPNVPAARLERLLAEPLLQQLRPDPSPFVRGMIACTGNSFCPFALVETKRHALEVVDYLDHHLSPAELARVAGLEEGFRIHVSGCPNTCGQYQAGNVGLLGKKLRVNGEMVEGCDVFLGGERGLHGAFGERAAQGVPFSQAGPLIAELVRAFLRERHAGETFRQWCQRTGRISATARAETAG